MEQRSTSSVIRPLICTALIYFVLSPISTSDISMSYGPWLEQMARQGPLVALSAPIGDYSPPYYYLLGLAAVLHGLIPTILVVKLVSLVSTLFMVGAFHTLLKSLDVPDRARLSAWLLLLPGVAINTSITASSDGLWIAPCLFALACAIGHRHRTMLVWCGLALAIKIQAVFIAPFFLGLLIARRVPLIQWAWMPAVFFLAHVPALLCGWPLGDMLTIYFRQTGMMTALSLKAPNLWSIVQMLPGGDQPWLATLADRKSVV